MNPKLLVKTIFLTILMGVMIYAIMVINKQNNLVDPEIFNLAIMSLLVIFVAVMYYRTHIKPIIFIDEEPEPVFEEPTKHRRKSVDEVLKENMPKNVKFTKKKENVGRVLKKHGVKVSQKPQQKPEVKEPEIEINEKDND